MSSGVASVKRRRTCELEVGDLVAYGTAGMPRHWARLDRWVDHEGKRILHFNDGRDEVACSSGPTDVWYTLRAGDRVA